MNDCHLFSGNWRQEQDPAYGLLQPIFHGVSVTDQELWSAAAASVTKEYFALPALLKEEVSGIVAKIGVLKKTSASLVDAGPHCEACRGICCGFGKNHFSVVDLLGYLVAEQKLFTPVFDNPLCPYHTGSGCIMTPALRPFNCTIFICDQIEDCLDAMVKHELADIEKQLRQLCSRLEQLLGNRFENGLLITYKRGLVTGGPLFRYSS